MIHIVLSSFDTVVILPYSTFFLHKDRDLSSGHRYAVKVKKAAQGQHVNRENNSPNKALLPRTEDKGVKKGMADDGKAGLEVCLTLLNKGAQVVAFPDILYRCLIYKSKN